MLCGYVGTFGNTASCMSSSIRVHGIARTRIFSVRKPIKLSSCCQHDDNTMSFRNLCSCKSEYSNLCVSCGIVTAATSHHGNCVLFEPGGRDSAPPQRPREGSQRRGEHRRRHPKSRHNPIPKPSCDRLRALRTTPRRHGRPAQGRLHAVFWTTGDVAGASVSR